MFYACPDKVSLCSYDVHTGEFVSRTPEAQSSMRGGVLLFGNGTSVYDMGVSPRVVLDNGQPRMSLTSNALRIVMGEKASSPKTTQLADSRLQYLFRIRSGGSWRPVTQADLDGAGVTDANSYLGFVNGLIESGDMSVVYAWELGHASYGSLTIREEFGDDAAFDAAVAAGDLVAMDMYYATTPEKQLSNMYSNGMAYPDTTPGIVEESAWIV